MIAKLVKRVGLYRSCAPFFPGVFNKGRLFVCALLVGRVMDALRNRMGGLISRFGLLTAKPSETTPYVMPLDMSRYSRWQELEELLVDPVYDLKRVPFEADVVIDAGGFMGMFSLLAAARWPLAAIHTFEPSRDACAHLSRAKQVNSLRRWSIHEKAVWVTEEPVLFEEGGMGGRINEAPEGASARQAVQTANLEHFVLALGEKRLVVKMDIEGAEKVVLPGLVSCLPPNCMVFIETHDGTESRLWFQKAFRDHGFAVVDGRMREPFADWMAVRVQVSGLG